MKSTSQTRNLPESSCKLRLLIPKGVSSLKGTSTTAARQLGHSSTTASSPVLCTIKGRECFVVMKTWISSRFYIKWRHCARKLASFEDNYNVFALNPYAHILLDNGIMALKFLSSHEHNDKYYATIMIQWLPVSNTLTKVKAILESTTFPMPIASQAVRLGIDLSYEPGPPLCTGFPNMSSSPDYWPPIQEAIMINTDPSHA